MQKSTTRRFCKCFSTIAFLIVILIFSAGCLGRSESIVVFAVDSTLAESGMVEVLVEDFEKTEKRFRVEIIYKASAEVLNSVLSGISDLVLVFAPFALDSYETMDYLAERAQVFSSEAALLGPPSDPAGAKQAETISEAYFLIAQAQAPYISASGVSGLREAEDGYKISAEVYGEMNEVFLKGGSDELLEEASEMGAYIFSDYAIFLLRRNELNLSLMQRADESSAAVFECASISNIVFPDSNIEGANALLEYLISERAQRIIGEFGKGDYEVPLYVPLSDDFIREADQEDSI